MLDINTSRKAIACFTHGVAHLLDELGTDCGLAVASRILAGLSEEEVTAPLAGIAAREASPARSEP